MRSALSFLAAALQHLQPLAAFVGSRVHIRPSCLLIYILFWLRLAGTKPSPPGAQDILSRFNGSWALHPLRSEDGSAVVGTAAVLEQDILPAGAVTLSPLKPYHLAHPDAVPQVGVSEGGGHVGTNL